NARNRAGLVENERRGPGRLDDVQAEPAVTLEQSEEFATARVDRRIDPAGQAALGAVAELSFVAAGNAATNQTVAFREEGEELVADFRLAVKDPYFPVVRSGRFLLGRGAAVIRPRSPEFFSSHSEQDGRA